MKILFALLLTLASCPIFAQAPAATSAPSRILINIKVLNAPVAVVGQLLKTLPDGLTQPARLYEALISGSVHEATELSLQTTSDVPGVASYNKIIRFDLYDHTKSHNFVTLVNSLEATPHLEQDRSITLRFSLILSRLGEQGKDETTPPQVVSGSLTTNRHCVDGETYLISNSAQVYNPFSTAAPTEQLLFVTASVLPSAILPAGNKFP